MRKNCKRFAFAFVTAAAMLVPSSAAIASDVSPPQPPPAQKAGSPSKFGDLTGVPAETTLGVKAPSGGMQPYAFAPYNCRGATDYPHYSSPGQASVHGRSICDSYVDWLYVWTELDRSRYWGWEYLEAQPDSGSPRYLVEATPHYYCQGSGYYQYRGVSNHQAQVAGSTYSSNTANYGDPFRC